MIDICESMRLPHLHGNLHSLAHPKGYIFLLYLFYGIENSLMMMIISKKLSYPYIHVAVSLRLTIKY